MAKGHARHRGGNRWQLEVDLGSYVDPKTGKRKRNRKYKTITAKGRREANLELARFVAKVSDSSYYDPEKINFVEFVKNDWLPVAKDRLSHTTLDVYLTHLKLRILPAFQRLRIDQVRPKHIIDFLRNLKEDGMRMDGKPGKLSHATIRNNHRTLNNIFNYAKEIKLIKESPLEGVQPPREEHKEIEVYTLEETIKLLTALEKETDVPHWQIIIKLAITTGMRRSELFGLEFKHIDLDNKVIHVRQALTYSTRDGYQIHEIKKGSRSAKKRDIVLSDALIEPIEKLKLQRKTEQFALKKDDRWRKGKHDFVLCDETGKPFHPQSMANWWKRFLKRHKLKYINIHALRHTSATLLINEGVHPKIISERLGHADIKTTMNIYGHALKKADKIATAKLDNVLFRDSKTQ